MQQKNISTSHSRCESAGDNITGGAVMSLDFWEDDDKPDMVAEQEPKPERHSNKAQEVPRPSLKKGSSVRQMSAKVKDNEVGQTSKQKTEPKTEASEEPSNKPEPQTASASASKWGAIKAATKKKRKKRNSQVDTEDEEDELIITQDDALSRIFGRIDSEANGIGSNGEGGAKVSTAEDGATGGQQKPMDKKPTRSQLNRLERCKTRLLSNPSLESMEGFGARQENLDALDNVALQQKVLQRSVTRENGDVEAYRKKEAGRGRRAVKKDGGGQPAAEPKAETKTLSKPESKLKSKVSETINR
jgi:hypothetical protein